MNFLFAAILFVKTAVLTNYNVWTLPMIGKNVIYFQLTVSETLQVPHAGDFLVTFNTPSGPVTQGFLVVLPAGASGTNTITFKIGNDWSLYSYTLTSWNEYIE